MTITLDINKYPYLYREQKDGPGPDSKVYNVYDAEDFFVATCYTKDNAELLVKLANVGFEKAWFIETGENIGCSA